MASRHKTLADAVATAIRGLNLTGIADSSVHRLHVPSDDQAYVPTLPAAVVCTAVGEEVIKDAGNKIDDVEYPIFVALLDRAGRDEKTDADKWLLWRQTVFAAFHCQQMTGTGVDIQQQIVEPLSITDNGAWFGNSLMVSGLMIRIDVRVQRP